MSLPSVPRWAGTRPFSLHAAPTHWPFLGTETGTAVRTSTVTVRTVATVHGLEHFCSSASAIWTAHRVPSFLCFASIHFVWKQSQSGENHERRKTSAVRGSQPCRGGRGDNHSRGSLYVCVAPSQITNRAHPRSTGKTLRSANGSELKIESV